MVTKTSEPICGCVTLPLRSAFVCDGVTGVQIRFISSILQLEAGDWNALCPLNYPFVRHEFLAALEATGCTSARSGWQAHHLLVEEHGRLIAAMPGFIKQYRS